VTRRALVQIQGRVQGVGFRYSLFSRARSLELTGWVRNRPDGSVEAAFEGDDERVRSIVDWCRRGPAGAEVRSLDVEWAHPEGESAFRVR
jgi:acylphosphatase